MAKVTFNDKLCKGCGLCILACPKKVLRLKKDEANDNGYFTAELADEANCISCASCALMCPDIVITVERQDGKNG